MEKEIWRAIKGYEGLYEVSNFGRVRSLDRIVDTNIVNVNKRLHKGKILKPSQKENGYLVVNLSKKSKSKRFYIHRLVAFEFQDECGEWFFGAVVNHKDENRYNNKSSNLEWCTQKYNLNCNDTARLKVAPKLRKTDDEKKETQRLYYEKNKEHIKEYKHNYYLNHKKNNAA